MSESSLHYLEDQSDLPPRIPEGEYRLRMTGYFTALNFGQPRIALEFTIADFGEYCGIKLKRYYNVAKLLTKAGRNGKVKHKPRGDFLIEYCTLFPQQRIRRLDRVPMEPFSNIMLVARVRDVSRNTQQKELPEQLKYSVVAALLRIEK